MIGLTYPADLNAAGPSGGIVVPAAPPITLMRGPVYVSSALKPNL